MDEFKQTLITITERLKDTIAQLRTGRASPALVERIEVEYYGTMTPLPHVATISCPEPRQLTIRPWDKAILPAIERAIQQDSTLGLNPVVDRDMIRLSIPPLTEERRRDLVKMLGRHTEDARIQVRRRREEVLHRIDEREKDKEISEDEWSRERDAVQKEVEAINKSIEEISNTKEREIMSV